MYQKRTGPSRNGNRGNHDLTCIDTSRKTAHNGNDTHDKADEASTRQSQHIDYHCKHKAEV